MTAKSKAELMKALRQRRKDGGLVEFRAYVTPEQHKQLVEFLRDEKP